jgi:DNA (cytosine-5)-methyltransferase 1
MSAGAGLYIGSLFSGIGGLELGLERSGLGRTAWQVEKDSYRRSVLARHWPGAERFDDVCTVGRANLAPVDLICGGFPCKDVSSAGKRAGLAGAQSGLWYEFARILQEMRPRMVVIENVTSGAKAWVDIVRGDLERLGYASLPVPVSAADCGALHLRRRVFVVAHLDREGEHALAVDAEVAGASSDAAHVDGAGLRNEQGRRSGEDGTDEDEPSWAGGRFAQPAMVSMVHGLPSEVAAGRHALGDSVVPQCAEVVGHLILDLLAEAA